MADVFISYAREDRAFAERVANELGKLGLDCFWDSEIPPGQTWADYIEGKLSQSRAVIVLWSEHSTKSQWVREEARMGREKSNLIPVLLDNSGSARCKLLISAPGQAIPIIRIGRVFRRPCSAPRAAPRRPSRKRRRSRKPRGARRRGLKLRKALGRRLDRRPRRRKAISRR